MWNLIKKDYLLILVNKMEIITFMIAIPIIISFGSIGEKTAYMIIITMVYLITIIGFLDLEKDTDVLTYSLPLKSYHVVISKYILLIINHIIITTYILGLTWILIKLNIINETQYLSLDFFKLSLFSSVIGLSFALPLAFSLKSKTSIRFISVLFVVHINYPNHLFYEGDLYNPAIDRVGLVNSTWFVSGIVVLMTISIIISLYGYKKKEF